MNWHLWSVAGKLSVSDSSWQQEPPSFEPAIHRSEFTDEFLKPLKTTKICHRIDRCIIFRMKIRESSRLCFKHVHFSSISQHTSNAFSHERWLHRTLTFPHAHRVPLLQKRVVNRCCNLHLHTSRFVHFVLHHTAAKRLAHLLAILATFFHVVVTQQHGNVSLPPLFVFLLQRREDCSVIHARMTQVFLDYIYSIINSLNRSFRNTRVTLVMQSREICIFFIYESLTLQNLFIYYYYTFEKKIVYYWNVNEMYHGRFTVRVEKRWDGNGQLVRLMYGWRTGLNIRRIDDGQAPYVQGPPRYVRGRKLKRSGVSWIIERSGRRACTDARQTKRSVHRHALNTSPKPKFHPLHSLSEKKKCRF